MVCPDCGANNQNNAKFCKECGKALYPNKTRRISAKQLILAFIAIVVISLIALALIKKENETTLGNIQTNNANVFRFLCQNGNDQPYFCMPALSNKILTYSNGSIETAFLSRRTVVSIFDANDSFILETAADSRTYFTSIDKASGDETDILSFSKDQSAYILNIYKNVIYYNLCNANHISLSIFDYQTRSYNLETKEENALLYGGTFVSDKGLYYAKSGEDFSELYLVEFSDIGSSDGVLVAGSCCARPEIVYISPLFINNRYIYYYESSNGFPQSGGANIQRAGRTYDDLGMADNIGITGGKIYMIKNRSIYSVDQNELKQGELIVSNVIPEEYYYGLIDFAIFVDPQDAESLIFVTSGVLSGEIDFWDENGNKIIEYTE